MARLRADDVKFRVRLGSVDSAGYYRTWLVAMTTTRETPALNAEVFYEDVALGPTLDRIPHRDKWWVWTTPGQMDMPEPTKDDLTARQHVKQVVRHRLEIRFSVDGFRFKRTTRGLTLIDRPSELSPSIPSF